MKEEAKSFAGGLIGGFISGAISSILAQKVAGAEAKGIIVNSETILQQVITEETELLNANYKFAIIVFNGDGSSNVLLTVNVNSTQYSLSGDEQAVLFIVNSNVNIVASGSGATPNITIIKFEW